MPNRGYADPDNHENPTGGVHDTSHNRHTTRAPCNGMTSVGEQVRRGGMTDIDQPFSPDGSLPPPARFQGGAADGGYDVAAERGVPTPTPGTTY